MAGFASFSFVLFIFSLLLASYACASELELDYSSLPVVKGLSWSFYDSSCPKLESVIRKELKKVFKKDIGQAAGLLRLHFHDCFVQVTKIYSSWGHCLGLEYHRLLNLSITCNLQCRDVMLRCCLMDQPVVQVSRTRLRTSA
jgi:hypothetical protein